MSIVVIIVALVSIGLGFLGINKFKSNEVKVIDLQKEKQKFLDNEQDVPETIEASLSKAHIVSLNYKKIQLVGFTTGIVIVVASIVKMLIM